MDGFSPLGGGEFLLLSLPFKANAVGTVNYVGNPADSIGYETTVFGANLPVPTSQIEYGAVLIDVVPQSNTAPTVDAGPDQEVECTGPDGAIMRLNGWGSDPDGDTLVFEWSVAEGAAELLDTSDPQTLGMFAIGGHRLILTASDGKGGVATDEVYITVYPTPDVLLANLIEPCLQK